jgi:branched-chain amino acid transport system ATP-binding protein
MSLLSIQDLSKNFGGLAAVSNVNIELENNELVGLIGPMVLVKQHFSTC